ncbi:MAG: response regulator, partial [Rhodoferax sp.]|nr:response regulator [Rhodoferax sp.]
TLALALGREPGLHEAFAHVLTIREAQEWTLLRKNGTRFKASLIFSPMHDAQGEPVGDLCMIYDISRQKEYESSLREAMRLAEQSSVAKSQFLANMSHEIRTPMNAILGMLQLLRNTDLQSNQRDYAEKAAGAARSLLGLLNDILDFSKVEAGKMQLNPEPFRLESLLADLSVILSSNLGSRNVDLLFDVDPAIPPELVGDAMRLKQILINLGGNAVKFTEQGQVVVRWTQLARTPERIKLAVAVVDSGIGIAPENQARIFTAFTQAEANTTRRFGGTGLGLVISTRLIRLMGGELELHSVEGQGSTFSFSIELGVTNFVAEAPAPAALAQPGAPAVRVLLVDDNPQALATSTAMMQSLGWQVSQASSGEQALALLRAGMEAQQPPPDALFVDWQMPGMDGWETLRSVRRLYGAAKPPLLILLSRQSREALAQRTGREQELLNGLMVKPLTAAMFERTLAQARDGSALPDAPQRAQARRLAGMRVLLVEDNRINQQVAQELLSAEGAIVALAENGQLGVDAVNSAAPAFDAVLMDLQMPVMDGIRASRLLREDPRWARLPIIAMTANAMSSDRDECLAAGMNDHVGKPFDLNRLVQTLLQHTRWEARAVAANAAAPAPLAAPSAPLAIQWPAGIDGAAALARMGGNAGLLQRSMASYISDARRLQQTVEQALLVGEREQAKRELHAFKGLSATMGVQSLSELAAQAEKLVLQPQRAPDYQALAAQLWERLAQILPAMERACANLAAAQGGPAKAAVQPLGQQTLEQLKALLQALQASDMAAMEMHANMRQDIDDTLAATMEDLDAAMSDLEFEAAALACEKLVRQFETTPGPTSA